MRDVTIDYAHHPGTRPRPFWPVMIISLIVCPLASGAAALIGCREALGSGWLSPANFWGSVTWGLFVGGVGGAAVAAVAWAFRAEALAVSIAGSLIVSGISGASLFYVTSMFASC